MRGSRLGVVLLAAAAAVLGAGATAMARQQPPWKKDPITHNDGKCHPERTGPGLGSCGYPLGPIPRTFASCKAFDRRISTVHGITFYAVAPLHITRVGRGAVDILSWHATTQIIMPSVSWPRMTAVQRLHVSEVFALLRSHEQGHVTIAEGFAKQLPEVKAVTNLNAAAKPYRDQLERKEEQYDAVTTHGLTQSKGPSAGFPGGEDVLWGGCS